MYMNKAQSLGIRGACKTSITINGLWNLIPNPDPTLGLSPQKPQSFIFVKCTFCVALCW